MTFQIMANINFSGQHWTQIFNDQVYHEQSLHFQIELNFKYKAHITTVKTPNQHLILF